MFKQEPGGAVEFDSGLFVRGFGRDQVRFSSSQGGSVLQNRDLGSESNFQLLLVGIEGLACQVDSRLGSLYCGAVLLHVELCVADFNAYLIFELVLEHEGLAIFQLGTYLVRLGQTIANRDIQSEANPSVGCGRVDQLVERFDVAHGIAASKRGRSGGRIEAEIAARRGARGDRRIDVTSYTRSAVVGESLQRRQHRIAYRLVIQVARIQVDAALHKLRAMLQSIVDHVLNGNDGL